MKQQYPISTALDNVRQMVALCRESCRLVAEAAPPRPIRSVGVAGAGIMGTAIAIEHAASSMPVVLMDKDPQALRNAAATAAVELAGAQRCWGLAVPPQPIAYTLNPADLAGCDLVVESIVEKQPAKQSLFAQIMPHLAEGAILATNTSTIPITRLARGLAAPDRFCGLHFCHPVRRRPLVEVIPGPATTPETLATVLSHVNALGKLPLIVADGPGFVVNRVLLSYLNEALAMITTGVPIQSIDTAMVAYGMPLGPLELLDEIGLDTALQSGIVLAEIFGGRPAGSELLVRLVKAGQFGVKAGAGFYRYPGKLPNPSFYDIHNRLLRDRTKRPDLADQSLAGAAIVERLLHPMVVEAERLLAEKKVGWPWQVDLAAIFGLGFPLWRGGLLCAKNSF